MTNNKGEQQGRTTSATISAAKSREPAYSTLAPVAFSKQLMVFRSCFSSWPPVIEPAMVITSPEKLPRSPIGVRVLHTSACDPAKLAPAVNRDTAIAVPPKR